MLELKKRDDLNSPFQIERTGMEKYIKVSDEDMVQMAALLKVMAECEIEVKGNAVSIVHRCFTWATNHFTAMKNAQPLPPPPAPVVVEVPQAPAPLPPQAPKKVTKRRR